MFCMYNIHQFLLRICLILLFTTSISCTNKSLEFWRQVPIQLARVSQHESFDQTFIIDTDKINAIKKDAEKERARDIRMDKIFINMLGANNWQYLKNQYGIQSIRTELISGNIHMQGMLDFILYIDQLASDEKEYLVIEGSGRFFAIRKKTNAILLSGDFKISPQRLPLGILKQGCIPIDISLYVTRIPGETTYYNESLLRYELLINLFREQENTYAIDYNSDHAVYQIIKNNRTFDSLSEQIAKITIEKKYRHVKLIDLSATEFINNQYQLSPDELAELVIDNKKVSKRQCHSKKTDPSNG